jgi:2-keto-4-pentenoate hydratase/2-oxohepta-3-ene-1,7-dioic acid hydratase in catechol pathway
MPHWVRFDQGKGIEFGSLSDEQITIHEGSLFNAPRATARSVAIAGVQLLTPCEPSQMICLWNNFHGLAAKFNYTTPAEPLYFLKSPSAFHPTGKLIPRPKGYSGRVAFEGELGIVIGKRCAGISETEAKEYIFGYTCINDVTAADILNRDSSFPQWARAKSFDGFGVIGPAIATGLDPDTLRVRSSLNGQERQNYPVADMFFRPHRLVSLISQDITLVPGDIIACGTSLGSGSMKSASTIEIVIDGIGKLSNVMG